MAWEECTSGWRRCARVLGERERWNVVHREFPTQPSSDPDFGPIDDDDTLTTFPSWHIGIVIEPGSIIKSGVWSEWADRCEHRPTDNLPFIYKHARELVPQLSAYALARSWTTHLWLRRVLEPELEKRIAAMRFTNAATPTCVFDADVRAAVYEWVDGIRNSRSRQDTFHLAGLLRGFYRCVYVRKSGFIHYTLHILDFMAWTQAQARFFKDPECIRTAEDVIDRIHRGQRIGRAPLLFYPSSVDKMIRWAYETAMRLSLECSTGGRQPGKPTTSHIEPLIGNRKLMFTTGQKGVLEVALTHCFERGQ